MPDCPSVEPVALEELATATIRELGVPGLAVAVTDPTATVQAGSFGVADVASGTPLAHEAVFPIGSVSKTVCALAVFREVERGNLDLDDPVTAHLPWFAVRSAHAPITVRHLLSHTAGIVSGNEGSPSTLADVLALARTEAMPPGELFRYSNVGYSALGLLLERVTGRWIGDVLRESVLEPAGMHASAPAMTAPLRPRVSTGYAPADWRPPRRAGEPLAPAPWTESDSAAGSICTPLEDFAALARLLLRRGDPVISEASFDAMIDTPRGLAEDGWGYGCGISVYGGDGRRVVGHTGCRHGAHGQRPRRPRDGNRRRGGLQRGSQSSRSPRAGSPTQCSGCPRRIPRSSPSRSTTTHRTASTPAPGSTPRTAPGTPVSASPRGAGSSSRCIRTEPSSSFEELSDGSFRAGGEHSPERIPLRPARRRAGRLARGRRLAVRAVVDRQAPAWAPRIAWRQAFS